MEISGILLLNSSLPSEALPWNFSYLNLPELIFISSTHRDHVLNFGFPFVALWCGMHFQTKNWGDHSRLFVFFLHGSQFRAACLKTMFENSSFIDFVQLSRGLWQKGKSGHSYLLRAWSESCCYHFLSQIWQWYSDFHPCQLFCLMFCYYLFIHEAPAKIQCSSVP